MKNLAIYSPAACASVGHGYIYAYKLCYHLQDKLNISLFTLKDTRKNTDFQLLNINLVFTDSFKVGSVDKKRFNKFLSLSNVFYGIYRFYYSYKLLKEFYQKNNDFDIYHLLEFEYFAAFLYFLFNKKVLRKTIIGLHSTDFRWISGRSKIVNTYKTFVGTFLPFLMKYSRFTTVHGDYLRKDLIKSFSIKRYQDKIIAINYGCNIKPEKMTQKEARDILKLPKNKIIGLFFGVFRYDKGLLELIEALDKIDDNVTLLIAGSEGDIKIDTVNELISKKKLPDRVIIHNKYLAEEEIEIYYYASDFVFITHLRHHIAFSGPLSLAVEHCRPVVGSDVGQIGEFVWRNQLGVLFKHDDWNDFVLKTNQLTKQLTTFPVSDFAQIQYKNSWEKMSNSIFNLY